MNETSLTFSNKTCYVALAKNKNPVYTLRVGKSGEDFTKVERKSTIKMISLHFHSIIGKIYLIYGKCRLRRAERLTTAQQTGESAERNKHGSWLTDRLERMAGRGGKKCTASLNTP